MPEAQRPLELILARNLMSALSTPAFLVDEGGVLVFYNEAAGTLLGKRFEELGTVGPRRVGRALRALRRRAASRSPTTSCRWSSPSATAARPTRDFEIRSTDGALHDGRGLGLPDPHRARLAGRDRHLLAGVEAEDGAGGDEGQALGHARLDPLPRARRRSATAATPPASASPSPTARCSRSTPAPASAASAWRSPTSRPRLHILLTHLHLDHIQGLVFFAPAFRPQTEIVIWGPASPEASLRDRIARYISAPLSPVEVRELPCDVSFRHCPETEWEIGSARIRAASVAHRGPDARLPDRRRRLLARLHPRPRAGARRRPRRARGGLDLRLRAGPATPRC